MGEHEPPIDPRIADRRDEVHREHRRRWWVRIGVICGLFLLAGAAIAATRSPLLDVDTIEVVGADRTGQDTVRSVIDQVPGTAMFEVDTESLEDQIAALPWVGSVEVRRDWPATVVVELEERTGVAVVAVDAQTWQTIDADGRVLDERPDRPDGLIDLLDVDPGEAPGEHLEGVEDLLAVAGAVGSDDAAVITGVRRVDDEVVLELAAGGIGLLGDTSRLAEKIQAAVVLLTSVDDRCIIHVDIRVPEVPTIRRDEDCAGATPPTTVPVTTVSPTTVWVAPTASDGVVEPAPTVAETVPLVPVDGALDPDGGVG